MICHNIGTSRGGGIAIINNSRFNIKNNILPNFTSCESISYRLLNTSSFIDIILIYRPLSSSFVTFLSEISIIFDSISISNCIILDDINIQSHKTSYQSNLFNDLLFSNSMHQHINFPTHTSGNTIDVIISHSDSSLISSNNQSLLISDHFAINFTLSFPVPLDQSFIRNYRNISSINIKEFMKSTFIQLNYLTSHSLYIEPSFDDLNTSLKLSLDFHAPLTISKTRKRYFISHGLALNYQLLKENYDHIN